MRINEIFKSIQGETSYAGTPFLFVRTTGCNLRCSWCDTTYAYDEGEDFSIDEIIRTLGKYDCRNVAITGGEPLLQEETPLLAVHLINNGYKVFVETNGSVDISGVHPQIRNISAIKCHRRCITKHFVWDNLNAL